MEHDRFQRAGGIAALTAAATVVVGIGMFATLLTDYTTGDPDVAESVAFVVDNEATLYIWNLITLLVFAVAMVPLALALHQRLKAGAAGIAQTATAFGLIWSGLLLASGMVINVGYGAVVDLFDTNPDQAESLWSAIDSVGNGLGGTMEIAGGLWVLLVSWAALRAGVFPKALNYLGLAMAASALVTIVPALEDVAIIFGLGLIVWLAWMGAIMLRDVPTDSASDSVLPAT